jgi:hypothetical protein
MEARKRVSRMHQRGKNTSKGTEARGKGGSMRKNGASHLSAAKKLREG